MIKTLAQPVFPTPAILRLLGICLCMWAPSRRDVNATQHFQSSHIAAHTSLANLSADRSATRDIASISGSLSTHGFR